ncbi:hypothetical protein [Nonomuraea polychroma]|uniref:hypothetical protein n=1 Tax=Nonomuraea polychroma TaxID=46176 RepID=UPI0019D46221|nr:hypothetical protein [Nonomuraea polychroma]
MTAADVAAWRGSRTDEDLAWLCVFGAIIATVRAEALITRTHRRKIMTTHQHVAASSRTTQALRAVVVLHVVALLFQAVTAGMLLSSPGGRALHMSSGIALAVIGLLHLVVAVLVWRPGGGSARFIAPAALLLVFTIVASTLGEMGAKTLHVPLGVLLFGGGVAQLFRVLARPAA